MRSELEFVIEKRMERTAEALRRNHMNAVCAGSCREAAQVVASLIAEGSTVAAGRSATLEECGILDMLKSGKYNFIDRHSAVTPEEKRRALMETAAADFFLASANAITENGEIYQVDGHASRIGPIAYGPEHVILVAGCNKIVPDLEAAKLRVQQIAAPANAKRMESSTPCAVTGVCQNCRSPQRICCSTLILGPQRIHGRIHVVLVKEILGY